MFNPILTNLMKKTILDLDLIDTGALFRSIKVDTITNQNQITIVVTSEDYIKYLIEPYNIVEVFFNQPGIEEEVTKLLQPWLESAIQRIFEESSSPNLPKPSINILFNP